MSKSGLYILFLNIFQRYIPANMPVQFTVSEQIHLHLLAATEGARSISKYKILDHFSQSFLSQKWLFQEFSPLIK